MNLWNLWGDLPGDEIAQEAQQRRAQRWEEPAPVPAQLMGGMVAPLTNFNRPGGDPIQQGIDLGMFGISPFRGRIATAKPAMTPQEELWGRAQQGDYQATGQLTGEMWQRDLREAPPMPPDPLYPDTQIRAPRAEPEVRARPGYIQPDDDYITMAPVPKGLFEPYTPPPKAGYPDPEDLNKGIFPTDEKGFSYDPDDLNLPWEFKDEPISNLPPDPSDLEKLVPPKPPEIGERVGDFIWDGKEWQFMDYMPPEGSVPPRTPNDWSEADDAMRAALERGAAPGMSYEEWQEVLRRMNASPNVLPRINPFTGKQ